MAKGKKTVEVKELLEWANAQLERTDPYADVGFKSGIACMIEQVLMESNTYNGHMHLAAADCEFGTLGYYSRKYF